MGGTPFPDDNPQPVLEFGRDGRLTYANPAARGAFPNLEENPDHPLRGRLDAAFEAFDADPDAKLDDELRCGDKLFMRHMCFASATDRTRIFLSDRTEHERVERLKEKFLHNVSHELRNPLTAIQQAVRLIIDGVAGAPPAGHIRFLEIADRNVLHLKNMINDLIDVTRAETGKLSVEPRRMDLERLIREATSTMSLAAAKKNVRIKSEVSRDLPQLNADPVRLRQVLFNLIDNALKFTPPGGVITIAANSARAEEGFVEVSVADTGRGIPEADLGAVFDRLRQVRFEDSHAQGHKGLGLGLYIARQIVARHGGQIGVANREGGGTTFTFTLPTLRLTKLLGPVLLDDGEPVPDFTLMMLEAFPVNHALPESTARTLLREARDMLSKSVRIDDAVLPEMAAAGGEGLVFAVIRGDAQAARHFTKRVQTLLLRTHQFKANKIRPKMIFTSMRFTPERGIAIADAVKTAASRVEVLISDALDKRMKASA